MYMRTINVVFKASLSLCLMFDFSCRGKSAAREFPEPQRTVEFRSCAAPSDSNCGSAGACVNFGSRAYCVETCVLEDTEAPNTLGTRCGEGRRCVARPDAQGGYCVDVVPAYAPCGIREACAVDHLCISGVVGAAARCAPVCDVQDFNVDIPVVDECLNDAQGRASSCTDFPVGSAVVGLCSVEVAVGSVCDQAGLRCSDAEPTSALGIGRLDCLPSGTFGDGTQGTYRCLRQCDPSVRNEVSVCACPQGEDRCSDPGDPGMAWACVRWPELSKQILGACRVIETCTSEGETASDACADNILGGQTQCVQSPFSDSPGAFVCDIPQGS